MTVEERRRPAVGAQVKRWRTERGLTLANVAERAGLNIGYLSQIENDKASPSLACLASIGDALDVPIAWFLIDEVPPPHVVRAADRPVTVDELGRIEHVDGATSRDVVDHRGRAAAPAAGRGARAMPATSITSCCAAGSGCRRATTSSSSGPATTFAGTARSPTTQRSSATRRATC